MLDRNADASLDGEGHRWRPGGFAYLPPERTGRSANDGAEPARFQWIRKAYEPLAGHLPASFVATRADIEPAADAGNGQGVGGPPGCVDP